MPSIAQKLLLTKWETSGNWEKLREAFSLATGLALFFEPGEGLRPTGQGEAVPASEAGVRIPLEVASVHLGYLFVRESLTRSHESAVAHLLEILAEALGERLMRETREHHGALPNKVVRAVAYLKEYYREAIGLHDVARHVQLSDERLSRLFHESLGVTFSEYLNRLRLDHCRKALEETDHSITEIAFSGGYQSISQFNRRFRAAEGRSPRAFRAARHSTFG